MGQFIPYDSLGLIVFDVLIYVKLSLTMTLSLNRTEDGHFRIKQVFDSIMQMLYQLNIVFMFIISHLATVENDGMDVNLAMVLTALVTVFHPLVTPYTSYLNQGIAANDNVSLRSFVFVFVFVSYRIVSLPNADAGCPNEARVQASAPAGLLHPLPAAASRLRAAEHRAVRAVLRVLPVHLLRRQDRLAVAVPA